jgi:hypothetical protein
MHTITTAARSAFALFATITATACATATPVRYSRPSVSADVVTGKEISRGTPQNAYSALEQLRPFFLQPRPSAVDVRGERPQMHVFIDGYFSGDLDVLKMIPASEIESITRVQPAMAFTTMGSMHAGDGVLMVRLRCRGRC